MVASSVIPMMPLYPVALFSVMKVAHRLYRAGSTLPLERLLYGAELRLEEGCTIIAEP